MAMRKPNKYQLSPDGRTATIFLTRRQVALVDAADLMRVLACRWCALWTGRYWYAVTASRGRYELMHRMLAGHGVDHRNFNGLDNRRANLRPASRSQNQQHQRKLTTATSQYKGVSRWRQGWRAEIMANGQRISSVHHSEVAAARWYNEQAWRLHGSFAIFNDLPGDA